MQAKVKVVLHITAAYKRGPLWYVMDYHWYNHNGISQLYGKLPAGGIHASW